VLPRKERGSWVWTVPSVAESDAEDAAEDAAEAARWDEIAADALAYRREREAEGTL